ncbi:MAG: hypothetical protein ACRDT2_03365 [Natronosporangium sp.]
MGKNMAAFLAWVIVTGVLTALVHEYGSIPTSLGAEIAGSAVMAAILVGALAPK